MSRTTQSPDYAALFPVDGVDSMLGLLLRDEMTAAADAVQPFADAAILQHFREIFDAVKQNCKKVVDANR